MNSSDQNSLNYSGYDEQTDELSALDYLLFLLATILIIVGVIMLFFTLRELYIIYQSPIESSFIARVAQFLTNMPFVVGASGNTIVIFEGAARILAFFLFFLFVSLVVSVGCSLLKAGINILPKKSRKASKKNANQIFSTSANSVSSFMPSKDSSNLQEWVEQTKKVD